MSFKKIIKDHGDILIIIIIGLSMRLFGIKDVGIIDYDTAYYANIAKVPIFTIDWFFDNNTDHRNLETLSEYLKIRGCAVNIIKPCHVFLVFLSFLIIGVKDYAIFAVSTICSIGVIILTYIIGYKLFNKSVGLIGSAVIAVSGQNIIYSRTGYPQADTTLLFCIAFLFLFYHLNSINRGKYFWYSAVVSGLLLLFHQSAIIAMVPLFILMLFNFMISHDKKISDCIKDCIYFISIMIIIFLASKYAVDFINHFNPESGREFSEKFYSRTIPKAIGYFGISIEKLLFYPRMFWILEGPLVTILIPISIIYVVWKSYRTKSINYFIINLVICIPLLFWIINYTTLKAIQVLMPFIAICIGILIANIFRYLLQFYNKINLIKIGPNIIIALIMFLGLLKSYPIITFKSNYKTVFNDLVKYMESNGGKFNVNQNNLWPIAYFYTGNLIDNLSSDFKGEIIFGGKNDQTDYKIIDWRQFIPGKNDIDKLINIVNHYDPIIQKKYSKRAFPILHYHRYYDTERIPELFNEYSETQYISVYDLRITDKKYLK